MPEKDTDEAVVIGQRWADMSPESLAIIAQVQGPPVMVPCSICGATVILSPLTAAHIGQMRSEGQTVAVRCLPCIPPEELSAANAAGNLQIVPGAEQEIVRTLAAERMRRDRRN